MYAKDGFFFRFAVQILKINNNNKNLNSNGKKTSSSSTRWKCTSKR